MPARACSPRRAATVSWRGCWAFRARVLAINKMDLVGYSRATFETILADIAASPRALAYRHHAHSALRGARRQRRRARSQHALVRGPTLLQHLESVEVDADSAGAAFRLPVQWVNRPNADFRGFAGQIVSGSVKKGDRIACYPQAARATSRAS